MTRTESRLTILLLIIVCMNTTSINELWWTAAGVFWAIACAYEVWRQMKDAEAKTEEVIEELEKEKPKIANRPDAPFHNLPEFDDLTRSVQRIIDNVKADGRIPAYVVMGKTQIDTVLRQILAEIEHRGGPMNSREEKLVLTNDISNFKFLELRIVKSKAADELRVTDKLPED